MAILKIARMGHPVLAQRAEEIDDPFAPEIRRLLADMLDTLADADGAGLAAPQVHVPRRLILFRVDAGHPDEEPVPLTALINPVIEPLSEETELGWEACLSLPGMIGEVPRHTEIRYTGLDINAEPLSRLASGFHARVVQHECDHLDGILYPMRMPDASRFGFADEMRALARAEAAERAGREAENPGRETETTEETADV
ncbi:MAG: peptide deformylase [Alphaproteobacteria bacterium]